MKGPASFQGEIITKEQKYIDEIKKSSPPEPLVKFQPNFGTIHPREKGIQVYSNEGSRPFPRGDNFEKAKIH